MRRDREDVSGESPEFGFGSGLDEGGGSRSKNLGNTRKRFSSECWNRNPTARPESRLLLFEREPVFGAESQSRARMEALQR